MRKWIVDTIKMDLAAMALLDPDGGDVAVGRGKVFSAGSAGLPGLPEIQPPFIVIRALPFTPALSPSPITTMPYLIWVHDQQGSFEAVIGAVLSRLRTILPRDLPVRTQSEGVLINCAWEADSGDLFDEGFGTATRYGQYRLTVRPA